MTLPDPLNRNSRIGIRGVRGSRLQPPAVSRTIDRSNAAERHYRRPSFFGGAADCLVDGLPSDDGLADDDP
jgi:hypothetical protein